MMESDPVLQFVVAGVELSRESGSTPLILFIGGTLVTGNVITAREWLQRMQWPADELNDQGFVSPDPEETRPQYLHLEAARTWTSKGPLPRVGGLWRARIAAIDAWSYGVLETAEPKD